MKKILVTIDWFYPAFRAGGPITSMWNFIRMLDDDFEFYVLTSNKDYGNVTLAVETGRWLEIRKNLNVFYASGPFMALKELFAFEPDLLIINGVYSLVYSVLPLMKQGKKIVFPRGMLSPHSLSVKSAKKKLFLSLAKAFNFYGNTVFWTNSEQEYESVKNLFNVKELDLIPNFVSGDVVSIPVEKTPKELKLISIGRLSQVKNYGFAFKVLQHDFDGHIIWDIYGSAEEKSYLEELNALKRNLPSNIEVNFKGNISPFQIRPAIAKYHFLFSTTLGENFGHSIFDSFAASRPVIISDTTPWRGLQQKKTGWDLPLREKDFRAAIQAALDMDNKEFQIYCENSTKFAKEFLEQQTAFVRKTKDKLLKLIN